MVGILEQQGQIIEVTGDVGMVRAEAVFGDGERAAHEGFGVGEAVGGLEQLGQVVEGDR